MTNSLVAAHLLAKASTARSQPPFDRATDVRRTRRKRATNDGTLLVCHSAAPNRSPKIVQSISPRKRWQEKNKKNSNIFSASVSGNETVILGVSTAARVRRRLRGRRAIVASKANATAPCGAVRVGVGAGGFHLGCAMGLAGAAARRPGSSDRANTDRLPRTRSFFRVFSTFFMSHVGGTSGESVWIPPDAQAGALNDTPSPRLPDAWVEVSRRRVEPAAMPNG